MTENSKTAEEFQFELSGQEYKVHEETDKDGTPRLYTNNGELLVLLSSDYSGGWSTQVKGKIAKTLLMDARVVREVYDKYIAPLQCKRRTCKIDEVPMRTFLKSIGLEDMDIQLVIGSLSCLTINFVPRDKLFTVSEYDGLEEIHIFNKDEWHTS